MKKVYILSLLSLISLHCYGEFFTKLVTKVGISIDEVSTIAPKYCLDIIGGYNQDFFEEKIKLTMNSALIFEKEMNIKIGVGFQWKPMEYFKICPGIVHSIKSRTTDILIEACLEYKF